MRGLIKLFTGLGALILLLIGIGLLAVSIYGYINSSIFLGDDSTKNLVLGVLLGVSLAIIGGSAEGLYGICKERPKLICGFQIIVILFMLIFFGAGAGFVYLPDAFFNGDCQTSTNSVIQYANNIYTASIQAYCKTPCACALNTTNAFLDATYSPEDKATILATYTNTLDTAAHSSASCLDSTSGLTPAEIALFTTISELELLLQCSDWCNDGTDPNLIYRFNDINGGKPHDYCYPRLVTFFNDFSYYGKLGFFVGGGVLFLMFACNMYICCSPQRRKRKNMRERFMLVVESDDDGYYRR
jgi:hypothetical protein